MKIIGHADRGNYICHVSENEVRHLLGRGDRYESPPPLKVGDQINIEQLYNKYYHLKNVTRNFQSVNENLVNIQKCFADFEALVRANTDEAKDEPNT